MNRLKKIIEEHGLEEDHEHVIIPYRTSSGEERRVFVLRRPNLIIARDPFHRATASLEDILEAIVANPEGNLWEELNLAEREDTAEDPDAGAPEAEPEEDSPGPVERRGEGFGLQSEGRPDPTLSSGEKIEF